MTANIRDINKAMYTEFGAVVALVVVCTMDKLGDKRLLAVARSLKGIVRDARRARLRNGK